MGARALRKKKYPQEAGDEIKGQIEAVEKGGEKKLKKVDCSTAVRHKRVKDKP